ncbi:thiol reductant ABC exporter subunit CydC [Dictyobacter aurantiacus]|uniref:Thiol reductant ABC exporter subunit CydC n=1 Tax=Dictyobacter aurantiacus TaxID=1936993 RepID=A0A401ZI33_9CHLR|nr:thiol reductant ABC exporter subunit CydC [Dictyobacter aurantiacus]GCE06507.1 thiol reductant ABC exporter subunit CydC [Dictyobacter aurantiacus]
MRLLLRLLSYLKPFRKQVLLAIGLGFLTALCNIGLLAMSGYLISAAAIVPLIAFLTIPIYVVRFTGIGRAGARYLDRIVSHNVTLQLLGRLRVWFYQRIEPLAPAQIQAYRSGEMLSHLVNDIEELQNLYLRIIEPLVVAILVTLLTFWVFSLFQITLAWTALLFLLLAGLGVPLLAGLLSKQLGKQQLQARADLHIQIIDGIQGMQDLLAFGRAVSHQQLITGLNHTLAMIQRRMAVINGMQQALLDLLMNMAVLTVLILATPPILENAINGVYLAFLVFFLLASFEAIQPLGQAFQFLGHSLAAGEKLFQIVDTPPAIVDSQEPAQIPASSTYALEFEDVSFAYQAGGEEILHNINLRIHPGSRVAIVGPSGSGKSTLVKLILRFWDPTSGVLRLNGQDVRACSLADLRSQTGVMTQDTYLFNETIRHNLLLARPEASEEELEQVIEQAQLSETIARLPDGLNTWIGEQGLRLSGGEQQRIAIARTLLKNAPILILDEATANLDLLTERGLLDTLDTLMEDKTTLLITHRLISMERMDQIVVLDHGRIHEQGTHQELLATRGLYWRMYEMQNGIFDLVETIH